MTDREILSTEEVAQITEAAELGQRLGTHWHEQELIEQNQRLLRLARSHEQLRARVVELEAEIDQHVAANREKP